MGLDCLCSSSGGQSESYRGAVDVCGKLVGPVQEMINPVITSFSPDTVDYEEGCLSIPGEYITDQQTSKYSCEVSDSLREV